MGSNRIGFTASVGGNYRHLGVEKLFRESSGLQPHKSIAMTQGRTLAEDGLAVLPL
jgi:hypothetical protein